MKKKILILSLASMIFSSTAFAYTDIDGYWGKAEIEYLSEKNMIKGYPDGRFNPQGSLTREESSAIISRYIGDRDSENNYLIDIDDRWSEPYIKHLLNERVITGYPDRTFKPTEEITRSEFVTMLYRYLKNENMLSLDGVDNDFPDIKDNWAEHFIHVLAGMKLLNGYPDGNFKPFNKITRGEAAVIITKLEKLAENTDIDFNLPVDKKKEEIINFIKQNYGDSIDEEELRNKSIEEIFEFLNDSNSKYLDINSYQNLKANLKGSFIGIGVHLTNNMDNNIEVFAVLENSPADRAGIKAGDILESIDGEKFDGYEVYAATRKLNGVVGTPLDIKVLRKDEEGNEIEIIETILREKIKIETVFPRMLEENIAYLKVGVFEESTYDDFKKYYEDLKDKGAKALIIDLRYNKGGLVRPARNMADDLVGPGDLYSTISKDGRVNQIQSSEKIVELPYVILINEYTASASEIVAAAVKDHCTGMLIGKKTFGKGTVQTVVDLPDGTGFKLTVGEYYSPNGNKIDGVGISPDIDIEMGNAENIGPDYLKYDSQLLKAVETIENIIK
ncbi:MAG: S41 family peptidase [Andreesenia angusta]|nr:S41 family peptidase [Andreesenia angusta]